MATLTVYADTSDGYIQSSAFNNYAGAAAGSSLSAQAAGNLLVGQTTPVNFIVYQSFVSFDTSGLDDDAVINSVELALDGLTDNSTTDFVAEARTYDWSTSLDTGDWRTPAQLSGLTRLATWNSSGYSSGYNAFTEDGTNFRSAINKTGATRLLICSAENVSQSEPTADEYVTFDSANTGGTTSDPKLTIDWSEPAPVTVTTGTAAIVVAAQAPTVYKTTTEGAVPDGDHDAYVHSDNSGSVTGTRVIVGTDAAGGGDGRVYDGSLIVELDTPVPDGVNINSFEVVFTAFQNGTGTIPTLDIYLEKVQSPTSWAGLSGGSLASSYSGRTLTTAKITYTPDDWLNGGTYTVDLADLLQEVRDAVEGDITHVNVMVTSQNRTPGTDSFIDISAYEHSSASERTTATVSYSQPNVLVAGAASVTSYQETIIYGTAAYTGDENQNATLSAEVSTNGTDFTAKTLYEIKRTSTEVEFAIVGLSGGTEYSDVRLTWADDDGVSGTNPITIDGPWTMLGPYSFPESATRYAETAIWNNAYSDTDTNGDVTVEDWADQNYIVGTYDDSYSGTAWTTVLRTHGGRAQNSHIAQYVLSNEVKYTGSTAIPSGGTAANIWQVDTGRNSWLWDATAYNDFTANAGTAWFLHQAGGTVPLFYVLGANVTYCMDPGNEDWQAFKRRQQLRWMRAAWSTSEATATKRFTAWQFDNMDCRTRVNGTSTVEYGTSGHNKTYLDTAVADVQYMQEVGVWIGGNVTRGIHTQKYDGGPEYEQEQIAKNLDWALFEAGYTAGNGSGFRSAEDFEDQLVMLKQIIDDHDTRICVNAQIIDTTSPIPDTDDLSSTIQQQMLFAYGAHLLIAESGQCDIRIADSDRYRRLRLIPEMDIDLGAPDGDYVKVNASGVYRRDFANGYVELNAHSSDLVATSANGGSGDTIAANSAVITLGAVTVETGAASLTLAAQATSITLGSVTVATGAASLSLSAQAPSVVSAPGTVTITAPLTATTVSDTVTISVTSTGAVATLKLFINDVLHATSLPVGIFGQSLFGQARFAGAPTLTYSWDTEPFADGSYTITVQGLDSDGDLLDTASVTVYLTNVVGGVLSLVGSATGVLSVVEQATGAIVLTGGGVGALEIDSEADGELALVGSARGGLENL
jgi:hypothetical protein